MSNSPIHSDRLRIICEGARHSEGRETDALRDVVRLRIHGPRGYALLHQ